MDKTSEIYGRYHRGDICHSRHKYHVCVTNTIINVVISLFFRIRSASLPERQLQSHHGVLWWRAKRSVKNFMKIIFMSMMTSKAVSRNFIKVIFMSMMTSKAVSRNFMIFFFMSMIVTMKYEIGTTDKVWAIITAHFTENWGFYTLLTRCSDYHWQDIWPTFTVTDSYWLHIWPSSYSACQCSCGMSWSTIWTLLGFSPLSPISSWPLWSRWRNCIITIVQSETAVKTESSFCSCEY